MPADLTPQRRDQLAAVQRDVNARVTYRTDMALYDRLEHWDEADHQGDCEDYALAKRRALLDLGWPLADLRLAVCADETGEGHAVLTVDTSDGTLVLDNRRAEVTPWERLPYRWVSRQDGRGGWVKIGRG